MPLDWLNTPLDADIGDLIARKKRAKTIELLRSQLQGRLVPPVQMRLQLADLLVQAGREAEAVPVLIGLADEFAGDGFVAKAIAILKRVDKVQPGREDVEARLAKLVKLQRAAPASKPRARHVPEFGMEEIRDDPDVAEAADAAPETESPELESAEPEPPEPEPEPEPTLEAEPVAAEPELEAEPEPVTAEPAAATLPQAVAAAEAALPPPADTDTSRRVRGVFRRFLASLPGTATDTEPPTSDAAGEGDATVPDDEPAEATDATAPDSETIDASYALVPDPEIEEATGADVPETPLVEDEDEGPATARYAPLPPGAFSGGPPETTVPDVPPPAVASADFAPEATAPPADAGGRTETPGVGGRIRGAFRWLVASLATPTEETTAPVSEGPGAPATAAAAQPSEMPAPEEAASSSAGDAAEGEEDDEPMSDDVFQEHLLDLAQDILKRPAAGRAQRQAPLVDRGLVLRYAQRLLATALFGDLAEEELLAVVRGLRLHLHGPGDVLVTEGERGQSIFVLASGTAKVFVRSPSGRNFPVAELREGEFFGEISSLSGRPRSATVTAAARCELLELDRPTMDDIARSHPRVADVLEEFYIRRASSPEAAAVRAVSMNDAGQERKAIEVLEAHFGQSRWDPRMRLRLADVLLKAGKFEDAVPVLIGLADDLARAGYPEKAIAVLKKIEKIRRRDIEVVNLAPRRGAAAPERRRRGPRPPPDAAPAAVAAAVKPGWGPQPTAEFFQGWLVDVLRDRVKGSEPAEGNEAEADRSALGGIRGYGPGLSASPLFEEFTDDELLAVIRGLRLLAFDAGDVIITEGEPGQSLFVLTTGTVKVFVRDPEGRNVALSSLGEGAFFGEIATLSGRPRSATVTAASRCELLELDKPALEAILELHPRVRDVLEEHYIARANDPEAAAIRGTPIDDPARSGAS